MSNPKIALVTGGNKGIGFAICRALAASRDPQVRVLLASRDEKRGQQAVKQLQDEGLTVEPLVLDVDSQPSIEQAAERVRRQYGGLDVLVNNAGIAWKGDAFDEPVARATIGTNYCGTRHMLAAFSPLMRDGGRVVNVSSMAGRSALRGLSEQRRQQMLRPDLSLHELDALMDEFIADVKRGDWKEKGWPKSAYGVSKAGVTMLTRISARDNPNKSVLINCCCPGWVRTDMAGAQATKSPEQGAVTPVKLALLPSSEKTTGKFWEDEQPKDFV